MPNVDTLLRDHVNLQVDCIDRLYLNGYVPRLQRPENLWWFLVRHHGHPIPSPPLIKRYVDGFVKQIHEFAEANAVPLIELKKGQRKEDIARQQLARFNHPEGVVMIGVAQEKVSGFRCYLKGGNKRRRKGKPPCYAFYRGSQMVNQYYFYILDRDFGLCFIKFSSYPPWGIKIWLNGHDWAKCQMDQRGIAYEALDNGFCSCTKPETLQAVCDSLSPEHIVDFFTKWLQRLPTPFDQRDRQAGFTYNLSILQMEVSLTQVFDRPLRGREFFEEVIRDNLDVGRPDRVQLLFERRITRRTPGRFRTRVITQGVQPSIRFDYKRTRVKQYFKLERALRTETTFNDTRDFGIGRSLRNMAELRELGRGINQRLLANQRVAQDCAISSSAVEDIVLPTTTAKGERAPALRWGEPRAMALFAALAAFVTIPRGFTNRELRERVAELHDPGGNSYTRNRMTYDLRRLRNKGLIQRLHKSNRYMLTPLGRCTAVFMSKTYVRIVRPVLHMAQTDTPAPVPHPLRRAWAACEAEIEATIAAARIAA